jgi:hypothetical protein
MMIGQNADPLEMSPLELQLSALQGELRELRQQKLHLDEKELRGQPIDTAERDALKARIDELIAQQRALNAQMDLASGAVVELSGLEKAQNTVVDFFINYKYFIALGVIMAGTLGFQIFMHAGGKRIGDAAASKQETIINEFMDEDMIRAPERQMEALMNSPSFGGQ